MFFVYLCIVTTQSTLYPVVLFCLFFVFVCLVFLVIVKSKLLIVEYGKI